MRKSNNTIIHALLLCATMLLRMTTAGAQSAEPFNPYSLFTPSADAWQMTRYGGLTPSLYTGAMTYSLPLYTYKDPDFTIPISLEYAFDGYRPSMHSGVVGYGWALSCGGVITREVRGIPDEGLLGANPYHCNSIGWRQSERHRDDYFSMYYNIFSMNRLNVDYIPSDRCVGIMTAYDPFTDIPGYAYGRPNMNEFTLCDTSPDIFHFNFMGHNGDFVMMSDGTVKVYGSDIPSGQMSVEFVDSTVLNEMVGIVIRTGDGYAYTFNCHDCAEFYSQYDEIPRPSKNITTYRLTSILAPNGRTVSIEYEETRGVTSRYIYNTDRYGNYSFGSIWENSNPTGEVYSFESGFWAFIIENILTPSRIDIQDGGNIKFSYSYSAENENAVSCFSSCDQSLSANLPGPQKALRSMCIRNLEGQKVDSVSLEYVHAPGTPKSFLSSVSTTHGGTYSFNYNLASLPHNDTRAVDHWGYWNGGPDDDLRNHLSADAYDLYSQTGDSALSPSNCHTMAGALTKITYPGGGWTDIAYEQNTVTRRMNWYRNGCSFVLEPVNASDDSDFVNVGGVRVKRLSDNVSGVHDNSFARERVTSFNYQSGILMYMPKYSETIHYRHNAESSFQYDQVSFSMDVHATGYGGCCTNRMYLGYHVAYPNVVITYPDGSRSINTFTSVLDEDMLDVQLPPMSFNKHAICSDDSFAPLETIPYSILPPSIDRKAMRGKPLSVIVLSADGEVVSKTEYSYECDRISLPPMFYNDYLTYFILNCSVDVPRVISITEASHGTTARTDIGYNQYGQVVSTHKSTGVNALIGSSVQWDPDVVARYTRYLHDTDSTALMSIVSDVVTARIISDRIIADSNVHYGYQSPDIHSRPFLVMTYDVSGMAIQPSDVFRVPSGTPCRTATYSYDPMLRPTCISLPGYAYRNMTWNGVNLSSVTSNGSGNVITYEWKGLVGLTGIHRPDGTSETYRYDSKNRLWKTFDSSGNLVRRNDVHLENEISSSVDTH